jgi:hypothetical protein
MRIKLDTPKSYALRWLSAWYEVNFLRRGDFSENYNAQKGAHVLASLVPSNTPEASFRPQKGRPKGGKSVNGVTISLSENARKPLQNLAGVLQVDSPQEAVRLVADEILKAAPHVELNCSTAENFSAIEKVVESMRRRCVEAATCAS